jgi:adenylate cyclase
VSHDTTWLAHLRHELRTPLNHILGYTEMLLEDVHESELPDAHARLRRVHANAKAVQARISAHLGSMWDEAVTPNLSVLAGELGVLMGFVIADVDLLAKQPPSSDLPQLADDLARIASAAATLRSLIATGLSVGLMPFDVHPNQESAHSKDPSGETGAILVVDDDRNNREMLARWLTRDGYRVSVAASGREALSIVGGQAIDLVLLDMMMPDMDGLEVLAAMRRDSASERPSVLMISAYDETHSAVKCIEAGAEDYLPKPFDRVLMRARVGASIERKRLRDRESQHLRELAQWNHVLEDRVAEQVALVERLGRLKRFFSPQLAELIVSGDADDPLKSHRREVTVCFLDLRGFTAFAGAVEPEEVMTVLREYHAEMGQLIMAHEGTLERFTGDGMMIFFNDPVEVPNPGERVVKMAVAMRERVSTMVRRWSRLGYELNLGIGIAQGFATIGAIGFEGRWDYGAIGSVTNLASRLCGEAKPGQILMSRKVFASTEAIVDAELVGDLHLKGFPKPVACYQLLGLRPDA